MLKERYDNKGDQTHIKTILELPIMAKKKKVLANDR